MAQTAVEWLVKELNLEGYDHTIEQAKQMDSIQKELSDKEIEKEARNFHWGDKHTTEYEIFAFIRGAKWAIEQLKQK
jgi:hypothetical protein